MKIFTSHHSYEHNWSIVSLAFFLRYPNPYSAHVVSTDVISRHIDADGRLCTTRLILKRGKLPTWSNKLFKNISESWVLEDSLVDPLKRIMYTRTRNLDHTRVLQVEESQVYSANEQDERTNVVTEARIVSQFGWGVTNRIEKFAQSKFGEHVHTSREGMVFILQELRKNGWNGLRLRSAAQA